MDQQRAQNARLEVVYEQEFLMTVDPSARDGLWNAMELHKLPPEERDAIPSKAAQRAETEGIYNGPPSFSNLQELEALLLEGIKSGPGRPWNSDALEELKRQVMDRAAQKDSQPE
jgi:hypothetical protein